MSCDLLACFIPVNTKLLNWSNTCRDDAVSSVSPLSMLQPMKKVAPSSPKHQFTVGDCVYFRDYTRHTQKWLPGRITGHIGQKMCLMRAMMARFADTSTRSNEDMSRRTCHDPLRHQRRSSQLTVDCAS